MSNQQKKQKVKNRIRLGKYQISMTMERRKKALEEMKRVIGNKTITNGFKTIDTEFFSDNEIIRLSNVFFFTKIEQDVLITILNNPNVSIDELHEVHKFQKEDIVTAISNLIRSGYVKQYYKVNNDLVDFYYIHVDCKKNESTLQFISNNTNVIHCVCSKNRIYMTVAVRSVSALLEFQNSLRNIDKYAIFEEVDTPENKNFSIW